MTDQLNFAPQLHKVLDYCIRNKVNYYLDMRRSQIQLTSDGVSQDIIIPFHLIESVVNTSYFKEGKL